MNVTIAKNAGFCFGVKRATDRLEAALAARRQGERIYTLGELIHNRMYLDELKERGVESTSMSQVTALAESSGEQSPVTVFVRAHGIPKEDEAVLRQLSLTYPHFRYEDCTCPYVKKIHSIAASNGGEDRFFALLGSASHPEVVGIMSYFEGPKFTFDSAEQIERMAGDGKLDDFYNSMPVLAVQTTQKPEEWKKSQKIFKKLYTNPLIFDTICSVTESRQREAALLAAQCDCMIVIGGRDSSNTAKLYSICKENCPQTIWIERPDELAVHNLITSAHTRVGIAAGASTPSSAIQEVFNKMSEKELAQNTDIMEEDFASMLETSFKTLNTGDTVTGTVLSVDANEVKV
ncbi:MAG: 4-hydroxy-3-methylbut-2-enyl diphosphate reductase, partial [Clostridia bacterium]|nr:4-hydroxy-3-methylbut-2-enyl diphosphate reductase [Clostridia bacterium]